MPKADLPCTLLVSTDKITVQTKDAIQKGLESKDAKAKAKALKQVILGALAGEDTTPLVMTVIRYCINEEDHELKKLLMLFWEVTKKHDINGKLRPEMILVW
jgi:coatomer subunit beta